MANSIFAAILSVFVPGLGQFYAGHFPRGLLIFVIVGIFATIGWFFHGWFITPLFFAMLAFLLWLWNVYDAYQSAEGNRPISRAYRTAD